MILTKVATKIVFRNAVAVVTATLLPSFVLGLPATGAMLLPRRPLFTSLQTSRLL